MMATNIIIIGSIVGGILLAGGLFLLIKNKKKRLEELIEYEAIEILMPEMMIRFFKQPEVIKLLKEDRNLLAVAIKDDSVQTVMLTCFDKEKNAIVSDKCKGYKYQKLSDDLTQMFGGKQMLVLQ